MARDATRGTLDHIYYDEEPHRPVNKELTKDEARRMAVNFTKLSDQLKRPRSSR
jgi:hypothetical protein